MNSMHQGQFTNEECASVNTDKFCMHEEIMMNDGNLESNLLTSSLLKMCTTS